MTLQHAQQALKQYFGYHEFRLMQADIIQAVLDKQDSIVLMPTGGGKSICYQIPAIIQDGLCVVISPLIALMKDQVESLKGNGIEAAFINSSISHYEQLDVEQKARSGQLKLLYVSPEKLLSKGFLNFLAQLNLNLFAVDEAHCISQWGHDFRPEYTQLSQIKATFPRVPVIALTATADRLTRKDIANQLHLPNPKSFIASFNRANLSLTVLPGRNRIPIILNFIRKRPDQSGIIYCLSRKGCEEMAAKLQDQGIKAAYYHAGLNTEERSKRQEDFINDTVPIICATIAFGMGIDKSNVRWVIHYNLPKNIESYYQEIGRAGRDGLPSDTVLFYSYGDIMILRNFIEESEQREVQLAKLERMQQFADAQICRRKILLAYFGEELKDNCGNCDVCQDPPSHFDGTTIAQKALSAVLRLKEKVGANMLINVLRGSKNSDLLSKGYQHIKTYGAGKEISYFDWQQYILQLMNLGLIEVAYDENHVIKITEYAKAVLFEGKQIQLVQLASAQRKAAEKQEAAKPKTKTQVVTEGLLQELRDWRKTMAAKDNVPPYIIFNDVTLKELSEQKPLTEDDLLMISGIGQAKLEKYGDALMHCIRQFVMQQAEEGNTIRGGTYAITYEMFRAGKTVADIATARGLHPMTIVSHLAYLYEKGEDIDIYQFIETHVLERVLEVLERFGVPENLKDIYERLNEEVPYAQLRLAIAHYKLQQKQDVS